MKSKKNIIIIIVVMVLVFGTLALMGIFRDFNAQRYVVATLNHMFYGEIGDESAVIEDASEEEILIEYEKGIASFAESVIPSQAELSEELQERYEKVCKKIYGKMKFTVQDEEKISSKEYDVAVVYKPSDVILEYMNSIDTELARISEKVEKGEYQGNEEEITIQMQNEFLGNACTLLEEACETMEYGKEQTMVFKVLKGENDLYQMNEEEIQQFLVKILRLDEIQD